MAMDKEREALARGELWSWLKKVMEQGAAIHQDYQYGKHPTYEHYSARMDAAARERADELAALTAQQEPVADPDELCKYVTEYVQDYVFEGDEGTYTPKEHERFMLEDAIYGMLADDDFLSLMMRQAPPSGVREDIHKRLINLYHSWRHGENRQIDSHWAAMSLLSAILPPECAAEQVNAEGSASVSESGGATGVSDAAPSAPASESVVVPRELVDTLIEFFNQPIGRADEWTFVPEKRREIVAILAAAKEPR